jgi:magnesium chelatase family protein
MSSRDVRRFCPLVEPAEAPLRRAMATLGLSARAWVRVLKLARTIADVAKGPPTVAFGA